MAGSMSPAMSSLPRVSASAQAARSHGNPFLTVPVPANRKVTPVLRATSREVPCSRSGDQP